jgi:hypothetical protein
MSCKTQILVVSRRARALAIVTALAMLVAPFCSSLCAASRGCSASLAIQGPEGGDCHHGAATASANGSRTGFFAATTCSSSDLPAATVSSGKSWDQLQETRGMTPPISSGAAMHGFPSSPRTRGARWRESYGLAGPNDRVAQTAVLQI